MGVVWVATGTHSNTVIVLHNYHSYRLTLGDVDPKVRRPPLPLVPDVRKLFVFLVGR